MYLLGLILILSLLSGAFCLAAFCAFRVFKRIYPKQCQKVERRLLPTAEKVFSPVLRQRLNICPPTEEELRLHQHWVNFGLKLENPSFFLHWNTKRDELIKELGLCGLDYSKREYCLLEASLVGGARTKISIEFNKFQVQEIEGIGIAIQKPGDVKVSFAANEVYLKSVFGVPSQNEESNRSEWDFPLARITHYLGYIPHSYDLYESLEIRRKGKWELSPNGQLLREEYGQSSWPTPS